MNVLEHVDAMVKGRGLAMVQAKVMKKDGSVKYIFSRPKLKPWDFKGWLWYWAHRRSIVKQRSNS